MIDELESVVAGFWSQNKRSSRMQNGPAKLIKHGKLEKY